MRRSAGALTFTLALAACSGGSPGGAPVGGSSSSPAGGGDVTAQVTTAWETFFDYRTPRDKQVALLENGEQLRAAIAVAARLQAAQHLQETVRVTSVSPTSATEATVSYALLNGTQTLLPTATGKAVLVDGQWKVSAATFCTLVELGTGHQPKGC